MLKNSFLFLSLFFCPTLVAQPGTTTESTVQLEEIFIDGTREKLLGNYEKAEAKFREVLQKDPANGAASYELARVYDALKKQDEALSSAKKAVELEPTNVWFRMYFADLCQRNGKDKESAAQYEQLVKMEPKNHEYYFKWAYHLVRASQPSRAIEVYEKLEKLTGVNPEVARHKHTLYMGLGDYKNAGKEIEDLIAAFPNDTEYRHLLAIFYEQIDEKAKARETYQQILRINPNDARAGIALAEEGKSDDIRFLHSLKPIFENPNTDIDTKIKEIIPYVSRLAETGDKNLGVTLLALASVIERVHPNSAKAHSVLGDVLYHSGDKMKALDQYQKTLKLNDKVWSVWEQLLYLYAELKDYDNLIATSEAALDIFPNQALAHYLNGVGYNGKGKHSEASGSLQQALMMSSKNPRLRYDVLTETGITWFFLKQYPKSDAAFEEALKINDKAPAALKSYSFCLASRGENLEKAKSLATRLNEIAPNLPASEDALAFVHYKLKDYKTAKELLTKALQHGGDTDPGILERYGDVLFQTGNATEAVQYWHKAIEKGGNSPLLERKATEGKLFE